MLLIALLGLPVLTALLCFGLLRAPARVVRLVALLGCIAELGLALAIWALVPVAGPGGWMLELRLPWIPSVGISFHLALDGLSLLLIALNAFLAVIGVLISWKEITERVGLYHGLLLSVVSGINGVFLAVDLILFYFFWEAMLVPMAFLIGLYGHGNRIAAAVKFFLYTLASGLLMLLAIVVLWYLHGKNTGGFTFDYPLLLGTQLAPTTAMLLMLGFFVAFAVKLPTLPLHGWLPDAHTEAPTAGSLILAGLLLKTGAYGLMRFAVPLFPEAAHTFAPVAMALGVAGILYGAVLAFGQTDLKRLIAYTSVAHMGFVLLGVYAGTALAWNGVIVQLLAHGFSTGGLFVLVGMMVERLHTRELSAMGGFFSLAPRMGAFGLFLALASLGLPGMANFVGEILILAGSFPTAPWLTAAATVGVVLAAVYSLWIVQKVFHGPTRPGAQIRDLNTREVTVLSLLVAALLWLGIYPQPVIDTARPVLEHLRSAPTRVVSKPLGSLGGGGT